MIDLAALIKRNGDALEAAEQAGFPAFPASLGETGNGQAVEFEYVSCFSRISRSEQDTHGKLSVDPRTTFGENDHHIARAREVASDEREIREKRENPCRVRGSSFPFLDRETGKTGNPSPAGPLPQMPLDAADWRAAFDERASVLEFDGKLPRAEAERQALQEITDRYGPEPANVIHLDQARRLLAPSLDTVPSGSSGAPREWREGVASLSPDADPCPGFGNSRWRRVWAASVRFLIEHGERAAALGWTAPDLFAVHAIMGAVRVDACGALMVSGGSPVTEVHEDRIGFGTLAYRRKPGTGPFVLPSVLVWEFQRANTRSPL